MQPFFFKIITPSEMYLLRVDAKDVEEAQKQAEKHAPPDAEVIPFDPMYSNIAGMGPDFLEKVEAALQKAISQQDNVYKFLLLSQNGKHEIVSLVDVDNSGKEEIYKFLKQKMSEEKPPIMVFDLIH